MINFYTNNTRENLQSFTGMPAQFNARMETQLLDHQRNKHTLRSQETVFDVMCRDPVNQANVESLARIMKQFLEKLGHTCLESSLPMLPKTIKRLNLSNCHSFATENNECTDFSHLSALLVLDVSKTRPELPSSGWLQRLPRSLLTLVATECESPLELCMEQISRRLLKA